MSVLQTQSDQFLAECRHTIHDVVRQLSAESVPIDSLDSISNRLDVLSRNLTRASGGLCSEDQASQLQRQVDILKEECRKLRVPCAQAGNQYRAPEVHTGRRGRPSLLVTDAQLKFLVSAGFTNREMANILDCSVAFIKGKLKFYNIKRKNSNISNDELDEKIRELVRGNQSIGPNAVKARLLSAGLKVPRERVRSAMQRIDPLGCAQRSAVSNNRLNRRKYSVAAPLSMWHIDGNHKLIRWGIVIHGAIDGYSRLIVFLHASDNNRAETVNSSFHDATQKYGLPSRIRVDNGGENNIICALMEDVRGTNRGSAIRGRSVHNQRIERAWVDVWSGCTNVYYDLFRYLESTGELDPDRDINMWALHYVFIPRINRALDSFMGQWNQHGLRTEHHATPQQLFIRGALSNFNSSLSAIRDLFDGSAQEGLQVDHAPVSQRVVVPRVQCPLTPERLDVLQETINPLDDSYDEQGIALYQETLNFITSS